MYMYIHASEDIESSNSIWDGKSKGKQVVSLHHRTIVWTVCAYGAVYMYSIHVHVHVYTLHSLFMPLRNFRRQLSTRWM